MWTDEQRTKYKVSKEYHKLYQRKRFGCMPREDYLAKITKPLSEWTSSQPTPELRARTLVLRAVRKKRLAKPKNCMACNKPTPAKHLGGHHDDYSKWWLVKWLCPLCHFKAHPDWCEKRYHARLRNGTNGRNQHTFPR